MTRSGWTTAQGATEQFDRAGRDAHRHPMQWDAAPAVAAAHASDLGILLELVPSHTSIEHPWFREHPDWYIWADRPNNWPAAFGGSAWTLDAESGRYYLHSFYPEQPDLDWRKPDVVDAMQGVVRFWRERGVDGFRVDALDRVLKDAQLRDDPPAEGPPPLPMHAASGTLSGLYSRNSPAIGSAVGSVREAAGDAFLVGEIYLPSAQWKPYLEDLDAAFRSNSSTHRGGRTRCAPLSEPKSANGSG